MAVNRTSSAAAPASALSDLAAQTRRVARGMHGAPVPVTLTQTSKGWRARVTIQGKPFVCPTNGGFDDARPALTGLLAMLATEQHAALSGSVEVGQ